MLAKQSLKSIASSSAYQAFSYVQTSLIAHEMHSHASSEPPESMQIRQARVSIEERHQRLQNRLYFLCDQPDHCCISCPIKTKAETTK